MEKPSSRFMTVCSLHFMDADLFKCSETKKRRDLKKTAIPSYTFPQSIKNERNERAEKRSFLKDKQLVVSTDELQQSVESEPTEREAIAAAALLQLIHSQPNIPEKKTFKDFQVQVNSPNFLTLSDLINSNSVLCSFTGLQNFDILNAIMNAVDMVYKDVRQHRLTLKNRIILTFVKLKLDLSFAVLSPLFGITQNLCKTYIATMVNILSEVLKCTIYLPDKTEILKNMPICFKNFEDTAIVLDCTEIKIQKAKCLCCRIRFYSHYKSSDTIKFMTGVSPSGVISYISKAYGGRASDKIIFEQSKLFEIIEPQSAMMVDKGFLIDDLCALHGIKLYRPPFLKQKKQLSSEEAQRNAEIAAARVHIERSNQRLKIFKILNGRLQKSLVPHVENIFTVICAVTNLSSAILANDKFLQ
ncbi:hypothetical protein RN001_007665 [Aquatica leii]|uniref:THAP-type domain-containing protein n=1 Tax=Aquatica leii TaxID=1421715 RepID=A0AAN7P931_9COLE|nr:hypothetical protein RN001_007665 [Aquatica leii]